MSDTIVEILLQSWQVLGQMAPYLLLGFLVAGVLSVLISPRWVERHLGGRGFGPILKASLFGVPLPLCSCGVIPVSASIRRHGASRAATVAFLLSTPQTGVDSIAATWALLGPVFAIFRPVAALVTGVLGGGLIQAFDRRDDAAAEKAVAVGECADACDTDPRRKHAIVRAVHYGLVTLPRDIGPALLVGVLIAGIMTVLVPPDDLKSYIGGGVLSILIMMAVGVPVYVCATASIPIAAGLMHMGASPGSALAFLIAGPATNAATFTIIWKVLGRRTALFYILTVAAAAVVCGLVLDWLTPLVEGAMPEWAPQSNTHSGMGWFSHVMAAALLAVLAVSYLARGRHTASPDTGGHDSLGDVDAAQDQSITLRVTGMTCGHCVQTVERALRELGGVRSAAVDLGRGLAVVAGRDLDSGQLVDAVNALGYTAQLITE